jgi:fermentation-respiration switch protein FrsA (DUF1100 family)
MCTSPPATVDPPAELLSPSPARWRRALGAAALAVAVAACTGNPPPGLSRATATADRSPAATTTATPAPTARPTATATLAPSPTPVAHPLAIAGMRAGSYPGGDLVVEQELSPGRSFRRYVVSYPSDGLKIYALLTLPNGERPPTGWPAVIFNHGYIPPAQYRTTERYIGYVDVFARNGYMVLKSDYRGHGSSEGEARGGYGSPDYTVDVLNALASVRRHPEADPSRVGMWGHSMGGQITLRSMVVTDTIRAGVIWAGVVGSYPELINRWRRPGSASAPPASGGVRRWRQELLALFGPPESNPAAWNAISPNAFLADLSGPLQLHHGTADRSVPLAFSETLNEEVQDAGRQSELYVYDGDDHNLSRSLATALARSVEFFDAHVKAAAAGQVASDRGADPPPSP